MTSPGRPTKLTPELQDKICTAIAKGAYAAVACRAVGLADTTYYNWKAKGEAATRKTIYRDFKDAIEKAEAEAELAHVDNIKDHSKNNWQASAWYLERKHAERWGRIDRTELSGPGGGAIQHEIGAVDELTKKLADIAARRAAADRNQSDEPERSH